MYDLESASLNAQVPKPSHDEFRGINYRNESLAQSGAQALLTAVATATGTHRGFGGSRLTFS